MSNETPYQTFARYLDHCPIDGHCDEGISITSTDNRFWWVEIEGCFMMTPDRESNGISSGARENAIYVSGPHYRMDDVLREAQRMLLEQEPWEEVGT